MNSVFRQNRATIAAGVLIVAIVAALLVVMKPWAGAGDAASLKAIVHDGEGGVHELPLAQDTRIDIATSLGSNTIVVKDGTVFVEDADCENHDCIRQGALDAPGKQIICLPHKLWIEVVDANGTGDKDGEMDVNAVAGGSSGAGGEQFDTIAR